MPFGDSCRRAGQKMCSLICPHRWQPLQQLRAGLGGDPPVPGSASNPKDTMVRRPGRLRMVSGTRTVTCDTGMVMLPSLHPRSPARLSSASTRSWISAPVGPTTIRGRRRRLWRRNGFSYLERSHSHQRQNSQDLRRKGARIGFLQPAQGKFLRWDAIIKVTELCLMNLLDYASLG